MLRTIVSFDSNDKAWLDHQAKSAHVPMTEIVRQAVHHYRKVLETKKSPDMLTLLEKTAGIWRNGDALKYQENLRGEWK
jgi:hypothetical protein